MPFPLLNTPSSIIPLPQLHRLRHKLLKLPLQHRRIISRLNFLGIQIRIAAGHVLRHGEDSHLCVEGALEHGGQGAGGVGMRAVAAGVAVVGVWHTDVRWRWVQGLLYG